MKLFSNKTLNPFDWVLIIGIIALNFIYSILVGDVDFLGSVAAITGVVCVVLVAKRSLANYIFGIVNVTLYAYISYKSKLYGDAVLNALYYLPMQFIGWYGWIKHTGAKNEAGESDASLVKSKRMTVNQRIVLIVGCVAAVIAAGYLLARFTADPQPYKDAATTVLSIIAQLLMVMMFMEQWFLWVAVNVVSVAMWSYLWYKGESHAGMMVGMWIFYLANSVNGLRVWSKIKVE